MAQINRREFLMGCSAAIAAMSGSQLTSVALGAAGDDAGGEVLVVVFLRGGMDVLTAFPPLGGADREAYEAARPTLKVPVKNLSVLNNQIGMNAALEPLFDLYKNGNLAVIPATGMPSDTRSHFDAMEYMELGTPDKRTSPNGWLARMLETAPKPAQTIRLSGAFSATDDLPSSLRGNLEALAIPKLEDFSLGDDAEFRKFLNAGLGRFWSGDTWLHDAGLTTLRALETVAKLQQGGSDAKYPDGDFAQSLRTVARVVKEGLGVRAATVDLGGWDTHQYQGEGGRGYIADMDATERSVREAVELAAVARPRQQRLAHPMADQEGPRAHLAGDLVDEQQIGIATGEDPGENVGLGQDEGHVPSISGRWLGAGTNSIAPRTSMALSWRR